MLKCGGKLPKGKNCCESRHHFWEYLRSYMVGLHCILQLTKNGTDVHEEETASATDNNSRAYPEDRDELSL
jgi:hypothetical protein